ncbi:MAG: hypothetical protein IT372_17800 [Polyangiaceae bacterium]|nr:hypothetical protein [Polyangiaceae bacterium]
MPSPLRPPLVPAPCPGDAPRLRFQRGRRFPRAIAWFGFRSFWGHVWHLAASVIATEDIDSRDWMQPDDPRALTARIAGELGARGGGGAARSLTEALEGDLWIDYLADTGDDASVSAAVARMLFEAYEVEHAPDDGGPAQRLVLPRGHLLIFGGDTAYPVATELEVHNRVVVPFNAVLRDAQDGEPRVLLGIPGNHDWYGGLDGFGRMFRARRGRVDRASRVADSLRPGLSAPLEPRSTPEAPVVDRAGNLGHFIRWVEAFRVGKLVVKRPALPLEGYTPVQRASYWALHLAPGLSMWGVDRQLRAIDLQQRVFFAEAREEDPGDGLVLCMPDPARAFLEANPYGDDILGALDRSIDADGLLVLVGDTHHYCREVLGRGVHVTAGGGGAFLHPARILRRGLSAPAAEFPGPRATLALALQIPLAMARGRSGFLVHIALALAYAPTIVAATERGEPALTMAAVTALVLALIAWAIGGWRTGKALRIGALALLTGAVLGFLPVAAERLLGPALRGLGLSPRLALLAAMIAVVYAGVLIFGAYLTALTLLGLEQHQAFSALAHPGYKHFVRLRVRRDGSAVDGWVLGKVDPLHRADQVVLVDRFTWRNPGRASGAPDRAAPATSPDAAR